MKILVTGSAGHLGEALMRSLPHQLVGVDRLASAFTQRVGDLADAAFVDQCCQGVEVILHTATLHKPHVATHSRQDFVDTNITGTLNLLEAARKHGCRGLVFTSTTSVFGAALTPAAGNPATWITEEVKPIPKNIYGVTKRAAEDLCELFSRSFGLPTLVLRTSRFFPEADDNPERRNGFDDLNLKVNEFLYRRVEVEDVVEAHRLAAEKVGRIDFGRYIISATTPFGPEHLERLGHDAPAVVAELFPHYPELFAQRGWKMLPTLDRVYVNELARRELGWQPRFDFGSVLERLATGQPVF